MNLFLEGKPLFTIAFLFHDKYWSEFTKFYSYQLILKKSTTNIIDSVSPPLLIEFATQNDLER